MRNLNKSFLYISFIKIIKTTPSKVLFEPKHNLKMYVLNIVKNYLVQTIIPFLLSLYYFENRTEISVLRSPDPKNWFKKCLSL